MSAESGYLRHGPYDIRGYNAGDLSLDITPTSIWVNGHVTTVAPTGDLHAATKKYVDDQVVAGADYWATLPVEISAGHLISVRYATASTGGLVSAENQEFAGIKTFDDSPIVPTPTTNMQASTKKYVDDQITGVASTTGTTSLVFTTGATGDITVAMKWIKTGNWVTAQLAGFTFTSSTPSLGLICVEGWPAAIRPTEHFYGIFAGLDTSGTATAMPLNVYIDQYGSIMIAPSAGASLSTLDPEVVLESAHVYKCYSGSVSFSTV